MDRTEAIIEEVKRRMGGKAYVDHFDLIKDAIRIGLELYDSGWQPTDPDVLAMREILAAYWPENHAEAAKYRAGYGDNEPDFQAALAAYRRHKNGEEGNHRGHQGGVRRGQGAGFPAQGHARDHQAPGHGASSAAGARGAEGNVHGGTRDG